MDHRSGGCPTGDPETPAAPAAGDERLNTRQAAELAGVRPGTWRRYTTPNRSRGGRLYGPPPDGHEDLSGWPWWWRSTVEAFKASQTRRNR